MSLITDGYLYYEEIQISNTNVDSNLSSYPWLDTEDTASSGIWDDKVCETDGSDIAYTTDAAGENVIDHEIDQFDFHNSTMKIWVEVPTISSGSATSIYRWWGKKGITPPAGSAAWNAAFVGVWHLKEDGNTFVDSTSNGNDGDGTGHAPAQTTGKIGYGAEFDSSNSEYLDCGNAASLDISTDAVMTMEAWVNVTSWPTAGVPNDYIIGKGRGASPPESYFLRLNYNGGAIQLHGGSWDGTGHRASWTITGWNLGEWHHVAAVYDGTDWILYFDGVSKASNTTDGPESASADLFIGAFNFNGTPSRYWDGDIDEARISNDDRSAAWIKATYHFTNNPGGNATEQGITFVGTTKPLEIGIDARLQPASNITRDFTSGENTVDPKIILNIGNESGLFGQADGDIRMPIGGTDGTRDRGVSSEVYWANPSEAFRKHYDGDLTQRNLKGSKDYMAHDSFLSNGWRGLMSNAQALKYSTTVMFGGADLVRQEVDKEAITSAVDNEHTLSFTDANLKPNLIFFRTAGTTVAAGQDSIASSSFGIAVLRPDGTIKQRAFSCLLDVDGGYPPVFANIFHSNRCCGNMAVGLTLEYGIECTDISRGSIGLTPRTASAGNDEVVYIAMEIKNHEIDLLDLASPTSTGNHSYRGVNFKPFFALAVQSFLTSWDAVDTAQQAASIGISTFNDGGEMLANSWTSDLTRRWFLSLINNRAENRRWPTDSLGPGAGATNGFDSGTNAPVFLKGGYDLDYDAVNSTLRDVNFALLIGKSAATNLRGNLHDGLLGGYQ